MPEAELEEATPNDYVELYSIGGTDAGAILGVNRYKNIGDVWHRLYYLNNGMSENLIRTDNARMERGRRAEPHIRQMYAERERVAVIEVPTIHCWRLEIPRHANLDGQILSEVVGDRPGVFEAKCMGESTYAATLRDGLDHSYYAQIQHYFSVTGLDWSGYAILNGDAWEGPNFDPDEHLHTFVVERNQPFIDKMEALEREFWNEFVVEEVTPPDTVEPDPELLALIPRVGREGVDWTDRQDLYDAIMEKKAVDAELTLLNHRKKQVEERIKTMMGDTQLALVGGLRVAYKWNTSVTFPKASQEALQRDHPEINVRAYANESRSRSLRISGRE